MRSDKDVEATAKTLHGLHDRTITNTLPLIAATLLYLALALARNLRRWMTKASCLVTTN